MKSPHHHIKKHPYIFLVAFSFLWIVGILFVWAYSNVNIKTRVAEVIPTPPVGTLPNSMLPPDILINTPKPTKFVYSNEDGDIYWSPLNTNEPHLIYKSRGNFGKPQYISISPNGSYLVYTLLSEEMINEFNSNPPYEYHGGADSQLFVVNLQNLTSPEKVLLGEAEQYTSRYPFQWKDDESGFYMIRATSTGNEQGIYEFYDLQQKKITSTLNTSRLNDIDFSPDTSLVTYNDSKSENIGTDNEYGNQLNRVSNKIYVSKLDLKSPNLLFSSTSDEKYYSFGDNKFYRGEGVSSPSFIDSSHIIFLMSSGEVFENSNNFYKKYLKYADIKGNIATLGEGFFENRGNGYYNDVKMSQFSNKLVAVASAYTDKYFNGNYSDSIFVYDFDTKRGHYLGWSLQNTISDYFFLNESEILITMFHNREDIVDKGNMIMNIETGESSTFEINPKTNILGVF